MKKMKYLLREWKLLQIRLQNYKKYLTSAYTRPLKNGAVVFF